MTRYFRQLIPRILMPGLMLLSLLMLGSLLFPTSGKAQSLIPDVSSRQDPSAASLQNLRRANLDALLETLESQSERTRLINNIRSLIELEKSQQTEPKGDPGLGARLIGALSENLKQTSRHITQAVELLRDIPATFDTIMAKVRDPDTRSGWLMLILKVSLVIGIGFVTARLSGRLLVGPRGGIESQKPGSLIYRIPLLVGRTFLDLVPIAVFAAVAYGLLPLTNPDHQVHIVALTFINGYILCAGLIVILRAILVPAVESIRLLPLENINANYIFIWSRRLIVVAVTGYFIAEATLVLGIPAGGHIALLRLVGFVVLSMILLFVMQNRLPVKNWLLDNGALASRLAGIWHVIVILYAFGLFAIWTLGIQGGFEFMLQSTIASLIIIVIAYGLAELVQKGISRGFAIREDLKALYPTLEKRTNRYLPSLQFSFRSLIVIVTLLSLLQVWGIDMIALLQTPLGQSFLTRVLTIVLIILIALVFWEGFSSLVERYLMSPGTGDADVKRSARARTLLPLLQNVIFIILCVMVGMIILSEVGINIAPLLAGAGVVGLAIGFGAQQLVKDIINGIFILVEDTISVGDWVDLGGKSGTVEAMSIRSIRLRDASANVHTIPFGSVDRITNMTRDFSYAVIEAGIGYGEDVDNVISVLHEIGAEMQADPEYAKSFIQPLAVQGLDQLADSAVVIKSRIMTVPGDQWSVRREFQRRMKRRFDELGIEIPFPHTTIYFAEDNKAPQLKERLKKPTPASKGVEISKED